MTYLEQSQQAGRHILPDIIRAFALFGIVLVNVAFFAFPGDATYHAGGLNTGVDSSAYFISNGFFLFKSYALFSLMFGAGLAYQMMAAQRRDIAFGPRYLRRLLGLLAIGILHVTFAFAGDILIIYALFGAILFLFRNCTTKTLLIWGGVFIGLQLIIAALSFLALWAGETFAPEEMAKEMARMDETQVGVIAAYSGDSFIAAALQRWTDYGFIFIVGIFYQGTGVLGFFLFGLAAVKAKVISDPAAKIWSTARKFWLIPGLVISLAGAYFMGQADHALSSKVILGMALTIAGAPLAAMGYAGLIAKWAEGPATGLKLFLARGGTATLTAYLLQSVILSILFCGYGFGLYMKIGAAGCMAIAFVTGVVSIVFSSLWRKKFERGPVEALLRRWTYLGQR